MIEFHAFEKEERRFFFALKFVEMKMCEIGKKRKKDGENEKSNSSSLITIVIEIDYAHS